MIRMAARSSSGSRAAPARNAWPRCHAGSSVTYGSPAIWASISASRWASKDIVSSTYGSTADLVTALNRMTSAFGSPPLVSRRVSRRQVAW
jgi:hypothetical protein